jgi:hypothetical protein
MRSVANARPGFLLLNIPACDPDRQGLEYVESMHFTQFD